MRYFALILHDDLLKSVIMFEVEMLLYLDLVNNGSFDIWRVFFVKN